MEPDPIVALGDSNEAEMTDSHSPTDSVPSQAKATEGPRRPGKKRAKIACRNCRRRKVRCDVYPRGAPCTNCRLDCIDCALCERRTSRWCTRDRPQTGDVATGHKVATSISSSQDIPDIYLETSPKTRLFIGNSSPGGTDLVDGLGSLDSTPSADIPGEGHNTLPLPSASGWSVLDNLPPYLTCNLSHISNEDVSYLQDKGCFSLPKKDILDDLLRCYFDYVHPHMPFIDETTFWEVYHSSDTIRKLHHPDATRISLLLFQAILFAGTTCAHPDILRRAGHTSRNIARREAFLKVRALYSLEAEQDKMALLQTFLLMSYWRGDVNEDKDAWHWSGLAVSLAVELGLHLQPGTQLSRRQETLRRRCWWSCVLRDRLVAMSQQRPPRLRLEDSDVPMLTLADYNVSLRSGLSTLSPGEELGKRTALSMFSLQLIRLMLCADGGSTSALDRTPGTASHDRGETWTLTTRGICSDEFRTGVPELDSWRLNLPEVLQRSTSPDGDEKILSCIIVHRDTLHIYYHKLILSRILPRLLSGQIGSEPSSDLELAQKSLNALAKLHDDLVGRDYIHYLPGECFGTSISTTGSGDRQAEDAHVPQVCTSSAIPKGDIVFPTENVQADSTSGGTGRSEDYVEGMDVDVWQLTTGITRPDTTFEGDRDAAPDPWSLGDAELYRSMFSDIHDLETDDIFTRQQ